MKSRTRHCFALDLNDDAELIAEYERYHLADTVWPEILDSIRSAGIEELEIYRVGDRMFMIMEVSEGFDPVAKAASDSTNPRVIAWEKLMWRFQKSLPFASEGEKWMAMKRLFCLSET